MQGSRGELMEHCGVGAAAIPVSCSEQGALLFCILCAWSFICFGFFFGGGGGWRGSQKQSCPTLCAVGACLDMGETSPGRWRKKSSPFCFQTADSNTMQYV